MKSRLSDYNKFNSQESSTIYVSLFILEPVVGYNLEEGQFGWLQMPKMLVKTQTTE